MANTYILFISWFLIIRSSVIIDAVLLICINPDSGQNFGSNSWNTVTLVSFAFIFSGFIIEGNPGSFSKLAVFLLGRTTEPGFFGLYILNHFILMMSHEFLPDTTAALCSGLENQRRLNHNLCFEKSSSLFLFWPLSYTTSALARISQKIDYFWLFSSFLEYLVYISPWQRFYKCKQDEEKKERNILQNFCDRILSFLSAVLRSNPSWKIREWSFKHSGKFGYSVVAFQNVLHWFSWAGSLPILLGEKFTFLKKSMDWINSGDLRKLK